MFALAGLVILVVTALLTLNARFGKNLVSTLFRTKWVWGAPLLIWGLLAILFGVSAANDVGTSVLGFLPIVLQAIIFSLLQIFIMFWAMARPQYEKFLPGDADAEVDWSAWVGAPAVIEEAKRMVESLRNWSLYEQHGTKPADGALFYGPPGTGKSLLAKIIAHKAEMPVLIIDSGSLNGPFVAMGMLIVKSLGRKIRKLSARFGGCIVFLDEIDAIGMARTGLAGMGPSMPGMMGGGGGMGGNGTLQTLLTEMSGAASGQTFWLRLAKRWGLAKPNAKQVRRVLWIGATNVNLDLLDPALTRSGRLGSMKLYFDRPNDQARGHLFSLYLKNKQVEGDLEHEQLKQLSRHMTGADINDVTDAAGRNAISEFISGKRKTPAVTFQDLWEQLRIKKWGHPTPIDLHPKERNGVATHEAGHGVPAVHYPISGWVCSGATLRPRQGFVAAVFSESFEEGRFIQSEEDELRSILLALNARAAEEKILGERFNGVSSDLNQAMSTALSMVEDVGMGSRLTSRRALGSDGHRPEDVKEAELIVEAVFEFALQYTVENRAAIEALAKALDEKTDLTGPQVIALVKSFSPPKYATVKEPIKKILARKKRAAKWGKSWLFGWAFASSGTGAEGSKHH